MAMVFFGTMGFTAILPKLAHAEFPNTPDSGYLTVNGIVRDIIATSSGTYVAGSFAVAGNYSGGGVLITTADGLVVSGYPTVHGSINAAVSDGNQGYYIGGTFTQVGSVQAYNLAHILSDGSVDQSFLPNVGNSVTSLILSSDHSILYIGGTFTTVNSVTYNRLAALNTSNGDPVAAFNPNLDNQVNSMIITADGSTLYIAGQFTTVGGVTYNRLAAVSTSNGAASTTFNPNVSGTVNAIATTTDNLNIYVGGQFTSIGGVTYNNLAKVSLVTASATPAFNPNMGSAVSALALSANGSILYAGGSFTTVGGVAYNRLAAIDTSTASATPAFDPNVGGSVKTLVLSANESTLYTGGSFTTVGGVTYNRLAAINTSTASATPSFNPNMGSSVNALILSNDGSKIFAGGSFTIANGVNSKSFLRILPDGTIDQNFLHNFSSTIYSMALSPDGSRLYLGGNFTTIDDISYPRLAAINTSDGTVISSFNPNVNNFIQSMVVSSDGSTLYIGGIFTTVGGVTYNRLAAVDTTTASATPAFNPNMGGAVNSLLLSQNESTLYAGGDFTTVNSVTYRRLAALDVSNGAASTTFNPNVNVAISAIEFSLDKSYIYFGGSFTTVGGVAYSRLAAVKVSDGSASTTFNPNVKNNIVNDIKLSGDGLVLYVGGAITSIGGVTYYNLAAVNTATASATPAFNPNVDLNGTIYTLALSEDGSTLDVGGTFTAVGSNPDFQNFVMFSESPVVSTEAPDGIAASSATLNGNITHSSATTRGFAYGTDPIFATLTSTTSASGAAVNGRFTSTISSLTCNTVYYARAYATNPGGTVIATTSQSFTTSSCPSTSVPASSFSIASAGGSVSASALASILAPSEAATAYLKSLQSAVPGCPLNMVCTPISSIQAQGDSTASSVSTRSFTRYLSIGNSGSDVMSLQKYLNAHGYIVSTVGGGSPGHETDYFGAKTKQALIRFQRDNKLPATGYFGPMTTKLIRDLGSNL